MSQELNALSQEAISRMTPYDLAERAVSLRTEMHNELGIEPIRLEDGRTFYAVTSGLVATRAIYEDIRAEGNDLVRERFTPVPLTAFADVVELQPPAAHNNNDGSARLFRVEESVVSADRIRRPFHDTAVKAMTTRDPVNNTLPAVSFDGSSYKSYIVCSDIEHPRETYLNSGYDNRGATVLADPRTDIRLETVRPNELDHELGVQAYVSGPAQVTLDKHQFVRITNMGVFYWPSDKKTVEVDIPPGTPQSHRAEFYRVPDGGTVGPNEKGEIVVQGGRANDDRYRHSTLNPNISPATIFELISPDAIDWKDGTAAFIKTIYKCIADIVPLDFQASYEQTLRTARDKVREAMLANQESKVGHVGCLAVAARLAELPVTIKDTKPVYADFFAGLLG